ncbi:uncharacterized protein EAF02_009835 [Botrytis sinoallii]|uniref:uncharacterized protein n=1 Tax=Botrytis sinoallii TaxID=1463999 RepID=UPI001902B292|nr:uncharacterized protein EAF02_009835 [Botrytis sinoallii]KAF7867049.1 hypothetical protein EAF02_009835 [Botrytis sinoallii]
MSSFNFTSGFPRNQNYQDDTFWNPISPITSKPLLPQKPYQASLSPNLKATHHRRQSEYLSRTMKNALGTVPLPNFNFDERKPRRITSPLSNVKPIGYERTVSRQMGYSHFSTSEFGEDVPSFEKEESGDNSPIITQSLVRGMQPIQYGASKSRQENDVSVLHLETSVARSNVNERSSPSKGKKSYDTLQGIYPILMLVIMLQIQAYTRPALSADTEMFTAVFRGRQVQNSLPLSSGAPYPPPTHFEPLGHRAVGYQHNTNMTSYGCPGQYMSQFNAQVVGIPLNIDGKQQPQQPDVSEQLRYTNRITKFKHGSRTFFGNPHASAYTAHYTPSATSASVSSTVAQSLHNRSDALYQPGLRLTDQLLREQGLLASLPTNISAASHHLGDSEDREFASKFGGEDNLPKELNCAVWIKGIPKDFAREFLYQELFNVISAGPIVAAYIRLGGGQHPRHAAKVIFKHPEHAARLLQRASNPGIKINGYRIRVEPNRNGHREFPLELHYRSRVVLVEVFNNTSMDLPFWKMFITNLCVYENEKCRHLSHSTPQRVVMEFRFARIFGQASVLLAGIRSTASFEGIVTARYIPDVPCDICDTY